MRDICNSKAGQNQEIKFGVFHKAGCSFTCMCVW